jgi:hypothetical protein
MTVALLENIVIQRAKLRMVSYERKKLYVPKLAPLFVHSCDDNLSRTDDLLIIFVLSKQNYRLYSSATDPIVAFASSQNRVGYTMFTRIIPPVFPFPTIDLKLICSPSRRVREVGVFTNRSAVIRFPVEYQNFPVKAKCT